MASMPAAASRAQTRRACSSPWGDSGGSPCPSTSGNGLPSTYASDWPCRTSTRSTAPGGGSNGRCRNASGSGPGRSAWVTSHKSYRPPRTADPGPACRLWDQHRGGQPRALAARSGWGLARGLGRGQELRDDHAPCLDDELAHLGLAEQGHVHVYPVEALVTRPVQEEPLSIGCDHRGAFFPGVGDAHDRLVGGDHAINDLADPELRVIADHVILRDE